MRWRESDFSVFNLPIGHIGWFQSVANWLMHFFECISLNVDLQACFLFSFWMCYPTRKGKKCDKDFFMDRIVLCLNKKKSRNYRIVLILKVFAYGVSILCFLSLCKCRSRLLGCFLHSLFNFFLSIQYSNLPLFLLAILILSPFFLTSCPLCLKWAQKFF